jgi:hypothetical protein
VCHIRWVTDLFHSRDSHQAGSTASVSGWKQHRANEPVYKYTPSPASAEKMKYQLRPFGEKYEKRKREGEQLTESQERRK